MPPTSFRTRAALWTAAGVLGAGLAAGGVAEAVSTPTPAPGAGQAAPGAKAAKAAKAAKHKHHGQRLERIAGRVVHGDVVVKTKDGYRTVVMQRGTVVSVSATSLQLRSADGFTATYALGADTWVRKGHKNGSNSSPAAGDIATVLASRSGSTLTATKVLAHPAKAAKPGTSPGTGQ